MHVPACHVLFKEHPGVRHLLEQAPRFLLGLRKLGALVRVLIRRIQVLLGQVVPGQEAAGVSQVLAVCPVTLALALPYVVGECCVGLRRVAKERFSIFSLVTQDSQHQRHYCARTKTSQSFGLQPRTTTGPSPIKPTKRKI